VRASLLDTLDDFERWDNDVAYVFPRGYRHERWSYRRVAGVAYQFARELDARHIRQGDAVLLWSPNCAEWVASFLGCALWGVIAVPVDDAASPDFARRIGAQVRTKLVLCPRERAAIFDVGFEKDPTPTPTLDPIDLEALVARHPSHGFRPIHVQPSDTLEIVFTSGTTADPKGVVLTHANVVGNLVPIENEIRKYLKYERLFHPIRFLNLLPLSHVFGQFLGIFLPPLMGGTVVFEDTFNPNEIMKTIRREHVSVLVAVPHMIESLKQKVERDLDQGTCGDGALPGELSNFATRFAAAKNQHFLRRWWTFRDVRSRFGWKFWAMISGGAALDRETEEFWHRLGYAVVQGYGLTETTSLISLNHPFHTSRGSIGKVLPGREIKLADDGEILVRGSGVASNYWQGEHEGLQALTLAEDAGWYRTGDLGALDAQGNLFFKGRKKEVIVTPAGMNIYPEDLEAALRTQPGVRDCVVVGLERGANAEPCAVLILRERNTQTSNTTAPGVVRRANESLAEYQRMRAWVVWPDEDFPRSSTQKPRRNVIRTAAEAALRGQVPASNASPLAELIARITGRRVQKLTPDANLESGLGLSSLERVELLGALEDRYQLELSETEFAKAATVGDLEKILQEEQGVHAKVRAHRSEEGEAASPRDIAPPVRERGPVFHYPQWALRWPTTWLRLAARYLLARPALFLLARPRVVGQDNLRGVRGPVLVISNHIADVDIGFIQTALPARIRHKLAIATRGELLEKLRTPAPDRRWFGRIYDRVKWALAVGLLNLFPLPAHTGFRKSFAYAGEAVDRGYSVLIFPEGKHTPDGKLQPFRTGVGLLANKLGIPVVPVRIDGLFEIKRSGRKHAAPGRIVVRIGKPQRFDRETDPEEIAQALQQAVAEL
jgi:long-chain acyl-CoA synthetase